METVTNLKNAIIASSFVGLFCFYLYYGFNIFLGILFGIGAGVIVFAYLRSDKVQDIRRAVLYLFSLIFWIGIISFWGWIGFESLTYWTSRHLRVYFYEGLPMAGTTLVPCIRNYPEIVLGTFLYGIRSGIELSTAGLRIDQPTTLSMFILVIIPYVATAIILGRGWCGRICFLGGIVEFFASGKKKRWTLAKLRRESRSTGGGALVLGGLREEIKDIRYGLALGLLLLTIGLGVPIICMTCWTFLFQPLWIGFLFIIAFIVFVIVLPFMTKKRWFCILCPIGALISVVEGISLFRTKVDKDSCDSCHDCIDVCQTYAMTPEAVEKTGNPTLDCIKCGRCIAACPEKCIDIYVRGTNIKGRSWFLPLTVAAGFVWYIWFVILIIQILPRLIGL